MTDASHVEEKAPPHSWREDPIDPARGFGIGRMATSEEEDDGLAFEIKLGFILLFFRPQIEAGSWRRTRTDDSGLETPATPA